MRPAEGYAEGNIPTSINLPFTTLYNEDGTIKDSGEVKAAFEEAGADLNKPVIFCCMGGVQAATPYPVACKIWTNRSVTVYDGSYAEYSKRI